METGVIQATGQIELEDFGPGARHRALFLDKIQQSNEAIQSGNFQKAVQLYTEAIQLDPSNHILYSNRSAAYIKVQQFKKGLEDAQKSRELNPRWSKAYLREGVALQCLGQHGDALVAFARGLAQDPTNTHLLQGIIDAAIKSPLKAKLEVIFKQLEKMKLDKSPFVVISVVGQELLGSSHFSPAIAVLESALKIGSCSMKLRGSVFSALSSAHWGLGNMDKAILYMQQDLSVAKQLGDQEGECRARGNLGAAFFSKGQYKEALSNHRFQLVLAMKVKDRKTAASALSSLGHVYTAIGDYPNALASHKQCVILVKQSGDKLSEARETGNVGAVYLAMGNFENAVECHGEHLKHAKKLKNNVEEARALSNLGSAYHYKRDYDKAIVFHNQVLEIAQMKSDNVLEARAYAGLGHAARSKQDFASAKKYHECQLDNALKTKDRVAEGRACSNLGIIFHQIGEHEAALKLHQVHLHIAEEVGDKASQGRALGNLGNAYSALGQHEMAVKLHKQELAIAADVNDRHSEGATHGNLAVAFQALGISDKALHHYIQHLNISRELKDTGSEARALCNIGNFHSAKGEFKTAIPYYEQYLVLSQELSDLPGEAKACFNLGYAHFCLGNFMEAVRYYEQDLTLGRETKDKSNMARAYCNLGLAHKALENYEDSLECQRKFLGLAHAIKNINGKFRALGNIGDLMIKMGEINEAVKMYNQQVQLSQHCDSKELLATAYGALGAAHRLLGLNQESLEFHQQELTIRQDINDLKGECRAHGNIGNVHISLGNFQNAYKCYKIQLEKSRELQDALLESQASGNLGITQMNLEHFEDAIGMFEEQLALLEQANGPNVLVNRAKAYGNLGDCYEALCDFEEAVKCYEQYLSASQQSGSRHDQDKAYRGLGNGHRSMGNLQQALVCFEKRLVVAHELDKPAAKASAYGELGCLHSLLGNFEQAVSCLQNQLQIGKETSDKLCEGDAACGLGGVHQQMGEYDTALKYHQLDLEIAESIQTPANQCRAYGNLGLSHESLSNYDQAIRYQEQHLSLAAQMGDKVAKTLAYSSLGRVHHALGNYIQSVQYLQQGLQIAEQLGRREEEAKIRHRLGLALWGKGDLEDCQHQLYKAAELFENIRRDSQCNRDYKLSLFDLQTASYQALQRVLVSLGRHDEALLVAERGCTRAFVDLLMERQSSSVSNFATAPVDTTPVTVEQLVGVVSQQKSIVLCFSVAMGNLYSWLITPAEGIVKFHECSMSEFEASGSQTEDCISLNGSSSSILDHFIGHTRESIGVESHLNTSSGFSRSMSVRSRVAMSETESEADDVWQQQLEELGEKLNAESDRTGFLRMVNRSHSYNSSTYSLSSLFSLSTSINGLGKTGTEITIDENSEIKTGTSSKTPISSLYHLLIQPMMEAMLSATEMVSGTPNLVLILQGDLFLIPFSILKGSQTQDFLFEKFNLMVAPSITSLHRADKLDKHGRPVIDSSGAVVVGNPKLPPSVRTHWLFKDLPGTEYEANIVSELLTARPLIGPDANKEAVLQEIEQVEVIHFATHISWRLSALVLSPSDMNGPNQHYHSSMFDSDDIGDNHSDISSIGGPSLSDFLLTAADILNLQLHAKLVVLSSGYTDERAGRVNADGVVGLTRALLSAGAQCVLYSLWPVPDNASRLLMRTLYSALQQGACVSEALSQAIKLVQTTRQFSHPSNWGGWVLVGRNIKLSSKVALMGHAICELLQYPSHCRESMRVLLHLIEKSLQRIHQGIKTSMYTTYQSIENKVGGMTGWKDLLQAVGFRFDSPKNGMPSSVFFPHTDPGDRLTQASTSLQALLGLPANGLQALSKFVSNYDAGEALMTLVREVLGKLTPRELSVEVPINVKLWQVEGVHEFLASLGFDLLDVGKDEVTLRMCKQANRRHLQFALQSLVAVFDTQEAPRTLTLDSSSSLESLSSSHSSSTSTSTFSKGSSPPLSPRGIRKRSLFNPAEMEKVRSVHKNHLLNQGGLVGRTTALKSKSTSPNPSLYLSHQSRIRSMYRGNSAGLEEFCMDDSSSQTSSPLSFFGDLHELPEHEELYNPTARSVTPTKPRSIDLTRSNRYSSSSQSESEETSRGFTAHRSDQEAPSVRRNSLSSQSSSTLTSKSSHSNRAADSSVQNLPNKDLFYNLEEHSESPTNSGATEDVSGAGDADIKKAVKLPYDPEQIAKMVLAEVGREKHAVESMQKVNFIQSQQSSLLLRNQYNESPSSCDSSSSQNADSNLDRPSAFKNITSNAHPGPVSARTPNQSPLGLSPTPPNFHNNQDRVSPLGLSQTPHNFHNRQERISPLGLSQTPENFHSRQDSGQGRSCPNSGSESDREHPATSSRPSTENLPTGTPPPVPSKPSPRLLRPEAYQSALREQQGSIAAPKQKVYDTSVDSTDSGIVDDRAPNSFTISANTAAPSTSAPVKMPQQVPQRPVTVSRPYLPKQFSRLMTPQLRPDSSASTSSQCSTTSSSSVQTVIYRPPDRTNRPMMPPGHQVSNSHKESAQARLKTSRVGFYSEGGYTSSDTDGSVRGSRLSLGSSKKGRGSVDSSDSESVDSYSENRHLNNSFPPKQQQQIFVNRNLPTKRRESSPQYNEFSNDQNQYTRTRNYPREQNPSQNVQYAGDRSVQQPDRWSGNRQSGPGHYADDNRMSPPPYSPAYRTDMPYTNPPARPPRPGYPPRQDSPRSYPTSDYPPHQDNQTSYPTSDYPPHQDNQTSYPSSDSNTAYRVPQRQTQYNQCDSETSNRIQDFPMSSSYSPRRDTYGNASRISYSHPVRNIPRDDQPSYNHQPNHFYNEPYSNENTKDLNPPKYWSGGDPRIAKGYNQSHDNIQLQSMYTERARKALPEGVVLQSSKC